MAEQSKASTKAGDPVAGDNQEQQEQEQQKFNSRNTSARPAGGDDAKPLEGDDDPASLGMEPAMRENAAEANRNAGKPLDS